MACGRTNCYRKSTAVINNPNLQTLAANDFVSFSSGSVTGESIAFNAGTTPVQLRNQGLYQITGNFNLVGTAAGNVTLQLFNNNTAVQDAVATVTAAAGDNYNVGFSTVIEVLPYCYCNVNTANLQVQVQTTGVDVQNATLNVVKLA